MQNLDSDLRSRLLSQHQSLGEKDPERRLTEDILDRYEALVNTHHALRQVINQDLKYRWPFGPLQNGVPTVPLKQQKVKTIRPRNNREPVSCLPSPFDRLDEIEPPKSPEDALKVVDDTIQEVIARYMPNFFEVHNQWIAERQPVELGRSKREFVKFSKSEPMRFVGGAIGILCFILILIIFLQGREPGKTSIARQNDSQEYALSADEIALLKAWDEIANTGNSNSLEALANNNYFELKAVGIKLVGQSNQLLKKQNQDEANKRIARARRIGVILKTLFDDEDLLNHLQQNQESL